MTALLLITLVLLSSAPAYAEWVMVVGNEEAGVTVYADPDTIRRTGNLVKAWHLNDFKSEQIVQGISYLSVKAQHQYDCTTNRERILALTKFSGNMGRGKVVYKDSHARKWKPVTPGSVSHELGKMACSKK
ncbi:MAG: hypothetical protein EHM80_02100 [Nitrospiraceae bacterium]|nr:MAG: hypothetical protein EHM80_02100 [Nitrospiraceae bacterium]